MEIDYSPYAGLSVSRMKSGVKYFNNLEVRKQVDDDEGKLWRKVPGPRKGTFLVDLLIVSKPKTAAYGTNLAF